MTKGFYLRAVTVSALVAFSVPFLYTILFGYSVVYDPPMDPAAFYAMIYEAQQEWLSSHSKTLNGFQTLLARFGEKRFWGEYAQLFVMSFLMLLVACLGFGFWERRVSRSNPPLNRTRADNARAG
ncbi:MAG: hypothetical protein ACLGHR_06620 [Gammaproteobacteria bacterium]